MDKLFGTDGIRGTANQHPITADIAMKFGAAIGATFRQDNHQNRCVIAKDTRLSGYMLESALTSGLVSMGIDVMLVGPMPTPAVPILIKSLRADFGIMISASHNEYCDNGFKAFDKNGEKICNNTQDKIEDIVLNQDISKILLPAEQLGRAKRLDDAVGRYIEVVKSAFLRGKTLEHMRIVVDCANGAAYKIAPLIFWELGAEVLSVASNPDGCNINKGCGSTYPEFLSDKVKELRADIGIAFDGDADRLIVCDENGQVLQGDHLMAIIATEMQKMDTLQGDGIVATHMSNQALEDYLKTLKLKLHRSDVGDRNVYRMMCDKQVNLGGEQSGHIILKDYATTGDGILAAIYILNYLIANQCKMSDAQEILKLYPQVHKNVKFCGANPLAKAGIQAKIDKIKVKYPALRFIIRKSGTEKCIRIMAEGKKLSDINKAIKELADLFV